MFFIPLNAGWKVSATVIVKLLLESDLEEAPASIVHWRLDIVPTRGSQS
jgi:hypothetical protein